MHHTEFLKYLELYAKEYNLHRFIRFQHKVANIKRTLDYQETGKWLVKFKNEKDEKLEEEFDCVILAQGHNSIPNFENVKYPNQEIFHGKIIHAVDYKHPTNAFEDKVNIVIGIGNSAVDIATELSRIGKRTYLSTRRGAYIFTRVGQQGQPSDLSKTRFATYYKSKLLSKKLQERMLINRLQNRFDHFKYGLEPQESIFAKHATISDDLPSRILSGTLVVKPNIKEFTPTGIIWQDGTKTESIDNVIFATGYFFNFDIVEKGTLIDVKDNYAALYKYIYPLEALTHPTLGVIGLIQPTGSIVNTAEMQARLFFHVLDHKLKGIDLLPSFNKMHKEVEMQEKFLQAHFKLNLQRFWVDYIQYMDELADIIGCKPTPWTYCLDPKLFYALLFRANVPYFYRLAGPHPWHGARETILTLEERVDAPFRTRKISIKQSSSTFLLYGFLLGLCSIFVLYLFG